MKSVHAIYVVILALVLPAAANIIPIANEANAGSTCAKGFCTSCPLLQNKCTLVTRKHGSSPTKSAIDAYIFRWDCNLAGSAANVDVNQPVFNFHSQLPYTAVLENLGGNPNFRYGGGYYNHPSCAKSFNTWQCVQEFNC